MSALICCLILAVGPLQGEETIKKILKITDLDFDGIITLDETVTVLQRYMEDRVRTAEDEKRLAKVNKKYSFAIRLDWFLKADVDEDHKLSKDELGSLLLIAGGNKATLTMQDCQILGSETVRLEWLWLLKGNDANGDGRFSAKEWLGPDFSTQSLKEFHLCDTDRNGDLNMAETQKFQARKVCRDNGYEPQ